ncbi:MAG: hypothetical protein ABIF01_03065 [Candidatus Micrarchaeota archaeon]
MRGLASILLVLVAAVAIVSIAGVYNSEADKSAETASYVLELERTYYSKLDFKHSLMQALSKGAEQGARREERAEKAAEKISEITHHIREKKNAEVWCGIVSDKELDALAEKITREKKPLKCKTCWGGDERTEVVRTFPQYEAKSVSKCLSFIDVDSVSEKVGVSKGGLALTNDPEVFAEQFSGDFVFGISYYDEEAGIGSVSVIPEGTWVGYG